VASEAEKCVGKLDMDRTTESANVGILGSAVVGQTLARGFKAHDFAVRIGSRTPAKLADFSSTTGIPSGTFQEVARWAEIVVLAVHGSAAEEALRLAGADAHAGKIIIDTTNPISDAPPVDGVLQFFTGPNSSLLEQLQAAFPAARFVKAFNTVGNARMVNPDFSRGRPTMFYCGNDSEAKKVVAAILEQFGWEPADMGSAVAARAIEPLCQLWCIPGFRQNHWTHAFAMFWS
jgi:8-hydroxy-5-deazaflavin:NADPH oxidoreductase